MNESLTIGSWIVKKLQSRKWKKNRMYILLIFIQSWNLLWKFFNYSKLENNRPTPQQTSQWTKLKVREGLLALFGSTELGCDAEATHSAVGEGLLTSLKWQAPSPSAEQNIDPEKQFFKKTLSKVLLHNKASIKLSVMMFSYWKFVFHLKKEFLKLFFIKP